MSVTRREPLLLHLPIFNNKHGEKVFTLIWDRISLCCFMIAWNVVSVVVVKSKFIVLDSQRCLNKKRKNQALLALECTLLEITGIDMNRQMLHTSHRM